MNMTKVFPLHSEGRVVALENDLENVALVGVARNVTHPVT